MSALAPTLQAWFTDRQISQRAASPNTIEAYKTTLRLLLAFATKRTHKPPSALDIADLDAPLIAGFLDHLEHDRHNSVATRNNRLAAIHSLFAYLALHHPEHAASIQRVLAIPTKRTERNIDHPPLSRTVRVWGRGRAAEARIVRCVYTIRRGGGPLRASESTVSRAGRAHAASSSATAWAVS